MVLRPRRGPSDDFLHIRRCCHRGCGALTSRVPMVGVTGLEPVTSSL
jgi:hypothetical protein